MRVADFILRYGQQARQNRGGWLICCPYPEHEDKTPSCSISHGGLFYCFGCGRKGNYAKLLHDIAGHSWYLANKLARSYTILRADPLQDIGEVFSTQPSIAELGLYDVDWATAYTVWCRRKNGQPHRPPWAMVFDRGFLPSILQQFEVGYDEEDQRIVIPLFDERGRYLGRMSRGTHPEQLKYKVHGNLQIHRLLYNTANIDQNVPLLLTEGAMDVWWLTQFGFPSCVSLFSSRISETQVEQLMRFHHYFVVAFDGDDAGRKGGLQVARALYLAGAVVDVMFAHPEVPNLKAYGPVDLTTLYTHRRPYPSIEEQQNESKNELGRVFEGRQPE